MDDSVGHAPRKVPNLGKPYHVTDNKLDRDFQADKPMRSLSQTSPTSTLETVDFIYLQPWISIIVK